MKFVGKMGSIYIVVVCGGSEVGKVQCGFERRNLSSVGCSLNEVCERGAAVLMNNAIGGWADA